ncbi:MAG: DMT family transporter [Candidatus Limnocylindrales bacterium]
MTVPARAPVDRLALGAALLTVVLWASAFVGIRAASVDLAAGSLALGRLGVGSVALGILVLSRGFVWPSRRDLALIVGSGVLWFAFYNLALNEAERHVDAGTASMLTNVGPILIAIFAGLFLHEGFPPRLLVGCLIAFLGALVIGFATSNAMAIGEGTTLGIVLCLVAALLYACGVTLQKPALRAVPAAQVTWMACVVGTVVCLPFGPGLVDSLGRADPSSIAWMVYLGLFPTSIGFTLWAFALNRSTAGRLGSTTYLVPPIAILMGWALLGEIPPVLGIAGGVLCIGGVIVARSRGSLPWQRAAVVA